MGGVKRTNDPIFSFAIKGAKEELFLKDTTSCFGKNCVYDVLTKEGGKYMLFGSTTGHTLTHYIEEEYQVDYRYFKDFYGKIIDEQNRMHDKKIKFYVRHLDKKSLPDVDNINHITRQTKNFKLQKFGGANICIFNTKEYKDAIIDALNKDKNILVLKD